MTELDRFTCLHKLCVKTDVFSCSNAVAYLFKELAGAGEGIGEGGGRHGERSGGCDLGNIWEVPRGNPLSLC